MIIRALAASVLLLSTTGVGCFAQEPGLHSDNGSNASMVTKGRPMHVMPPDIATGVNAAKGDGRPEAGMVCPVPGMGGIGGMHGMGHGPNMIKALERSGVVLSDDQVEQMTNLRTDLLKTVMPKKDRVISLAGDLKETLSASTINDDQARKIFADIKNEIDASWSKLVDHVIAVSHVFTADQRHKLKIAVDRWSLGPLGHPNDGPISPPPVPSN